jgi:hypothetical protein
VKEEIARWLVHDCTINFQTCLLFVRLSHSRCARQSQGQRIPWRQQSFACLAHNLIELRKGRLFYFFFQPAESLLCFFVCHASLSACIAWSLRLSAPASGASVWWGGGLATWPYVLCVALSDLADSAVDRHTATAAYCVCCCM